MAYTQYIMAYTYLYAIAMFLAKVVYLRMNQRHPLSRHTHHTAERR